MLRWWTQGIIYLVSFAHHRSITSLSPLSYCIRVFVSSSSHHLHKMKNSKEEVFEELKTNFEWREVKSVQSHKQEVAMKTILRFLIVLALVLTSVAITSFTFANSTVGLPHRQRGLGRRHNLANRCYANWFTVTASHLVHSISGFTDIPRPHSTENSIC